MAATAAKAAATWASLLALVVLWPNGVCEAQGAQGPQVTVSGGVLSGVVVAGECGTRDYWAFRGIPFAAPPVGDLRFKAPRPHPGWQGVRSAAEEASMCPQVKDGELRGAEDCLHLNVYTPSLACPARGFAVIVYFYGGSFIDGSSNHAPSFGPDFLVHNDVVLVMPNYREGALGFLNLDTAGVPGNAGLKDGLAALRWVRDNVAAFCGDPDRVTAMGQSSGSKMVAYMSLAEASRGLYRAAIQLSGVAISQMAYTEDNVERARTLAARLGETADTVGDTASLERALLRAPWEDITRQSFYMLNHSGWGLNYNWFTPSLERRTVVARRSLQGPVDADGEPVVLASDPESLLRDPPVPRVPTLTGVVSMEGLAFSWPVLSRPEAMELLVRNLTDLLRADFVQVGSATAQAHGVRTSPSDALLQEIARMVKDKYFQGHDPSTDYPIGISALLGDMRYVYPLYRWATTLDTQKAPMYLYLFDRVTQFNYNRVRLSVHAPGATHGDDLGYLFRVTEPRLDQDIAGDGVANQTLREHTKLITDFTKTLRVPLLEGADVAQPGRRQRPPYLYIGRDFREVRVENTFGAQDRMAFWDDVTAMMLDPGRSSSAGVTATPGLWAAVGMVLLAAAATRSG